MNNIFIWFFAGFILLGSAVHAQSSNEASCINAQDIIFPLEANDFSKSAILLNEMQVNALYYLYQDKFTFWYRFVVTENGEINYRVTPSNKDDVYETVSYKYSGNSFCDDLVNEKINPTPVKRGVMRTTLGKAVVSNAIDAIKGDTIYLSVLSLNSADCGHKLFLESAGQNLSLHAIHRPCYNVKLINEYIDTEIEVQDIEEVELVLDELLPPVTPKETIAEKVEEVPEAEPVEAESIDMDDITEDKQDLTVLQDISMETKVPGKLSVGDKIFLDRVYFYVNTFAFKTGAEEELEQIAEFLKENPEIKVEIQGHTANNTKKITPDPNYKNLGPEWYFKGSSTKLSKKRATAVEEFLIEKGVSSSQLKSNGYGDTLKRFPNPKNNEEIKKNMRVEIIILSEE